MGVFGDGHIGRAARANLQNGTPLGEPRALLVVLLTPLVEAVESLGHRLAVGPRDELSALVHLHHS